MLCIVFILASVIMCVCIGIYPVISHSPVWSVFLKVIFLVCAHFLLLLLLASYYRTIFAVHKEIPETFYLTDEQLEELDQYVSCYKKLSLFNWRASERDTIRGNNRRYIYVHIYYLVRETTLCYVKWEELSASHF